MPARQGPQLNSNSRRGKRREAEASKSLVRGMPLAGRRGVGRGRWRWDREMGPKLALDTWVRRVGGQGDRLGGKCNSKREVVGADRREGLGREQARTFQGRAASPALLPRAGRAASVA